MGIRGALHQALAKLVRRASGNQEKMACGNLQLCTGLEASIERETYTVGKRQG